MPTKKKAAPKKAGAAKKSTAGSKKSVKKKQKALVCANGEQCFWTTDGAVLSNLVELGEALERMSNEVFSYHVTKEKNDFADWVEAILDDAELAGSLRKSKKPATAHAVVLRRLKIYAL